MTRLIEQRIDAEGPRPLPRDFPDIIEFVAKNDDGSRAFPERDRYYAAAKEGRMLISNEPPHTLDDSLDRLMSDSSHADQKLRLLASTVKASLVRRGAFDEAEKQGPGAKPAVEIVAPRKLLNNRNIAAVTLAEHAADRLAKIAPEIEWRMAYDVYYQAPLQDPSAGRPSPRKHPKYASQSLYMAEPSFGGPDRAKYLVAIDDASRFGKAFRDLHIFAEQQGREMLAAAAFESYITPKLRASDEAVRDLNRAYGREGIATLDKGLAPFGLRHDLLTESEMRFFADDPMLEPKPGQTRAAAAASYLATEAEHQTLPTLVPSQLQARLQASDLRRISGRPAVAVAMPRPEPDTRGRRFDMSPSP